jgi:hypothetical protein
MLLLWENGRSLWGRLRRFIGGPCNIGSQPVFLSVNWPCISKVTEVEESVGHPTRLLLTMEVFVIGFWRKGLLFSFCFFIVHFTFWLYLSSRYFVVNHLMVSGPYDNPTQ